MRLSGVFFEALSAKQIEGEIELFEKMVSIYVGDLLICNRVAVKSCQNKRDIYLDNGFLFTLEKPLTPEQERRLRGDISSGIAWLENFSITRAIILSTILIVSVFSFRYTLNQAVPFLATIFPASWEREIGENSYQALKKTVLESTGLSTNRIETLQLAASEIALANGFESPQIIFHKSELIGANALAFPGGPIVITDDLVALMKDDDLILAVIAHEFAHIQERHSLQQIIEVVGVAAAASVLFGSNDMLLEEASVVGINLWASKKSRTFEKEADLIALKYMENARLDKSAFAKAIHSLTEHYCGQSSKSVQKCVDHSESGWFSSHPSGSERMDYLSDPH